VARSSAERTEQNPKSRDARLLYNHTILYLPYTILAFHSILDVSMFSIRPATLTDAPLLLTLIRELAEYERLGHEVRVTEDASARDAFGAAPKFRAVIAEWEGQTAGYAVFFEFYSTFQGRAGLFLEDIFVRPEFRKNGIGKALLSHVAGIAWREEYFCMRWEVLDWNTPAIDFYRRFGAVYMDEWKAACLIGDALQTVATQAT
jgi:GNAT superfamily N-acetyltransferase